MGIQKRRASPRQSIDRRRLRQWVTAECTDPVILIVDRNEQDIRPSFYRWQRFIDRTRQGRRLEVSTIVDKTRVTRSFQFVK